MLKKLNSLTNAQMLVAILSFVLLSYLFAYALAMYGGSLECAFDGNSLNFCGVTYSMYNVVGGIILSLIVNFTMLNLMLGSYAAPVKTKAKKKKK